MCGRYVVSRADTELAEFFDVDAQDDSLPRPSFNIAPTSLVPIVVESVKRRRDDGRSSRRLAAARWGLVPPWSKDASGGARLFNARIEEAAEKPSFRSAVVRRRAAVPASGYYEWRTEGAEKTPFYIAPDEDAPFAFAGLYEWWRDPVGGESAPWVLSTTILTQEATGPLAEIHSRMPVVLDPELLDDWIDPETEGDEGLLGAAAEAGRGAVEHLVARQVDRAVGNVRNDSADLLVPVNPA